MSKVNVKEKPSLALWMMPMKDEMQYEKIKALSMIMMYNKLIADIIVADIIVDSYVYRFNFKHHYNIKEFLLISFKTMY